MPAVMKPEVVLHTPVEPPTEAVAVAQWCVPRPQGRGCSFCPGEGAALLVRSVPRLPERIGSVLGIRLPFGEQPSVLAICADCIRVIDDAERTNVLRQAMCSHFEATQDASFSENLRRGGRRTQRLSSSAMAMTRSGAVSASFYPTTAATAAADDQQSQASSCDGCGSSSTSGGGGGSRGHSCAGASGEQLDRIEQQQQQQQQQAALASQRVVVPKVARKRYFCSQCEKSFTAKSHYDDHVNKHSAAKKFVCVLCGKAFKFKRGLREHARDAHARDVHSGGSSAEPLYTVLDGEDLSAYRAGDQLAAGCGFTAAAHSGAGAGAEPKLVASIKVEPASGRGRDDDYYDDECDDFDDECDNLAPTRPVASARLMSSTLCHDSTSRSGGSHQESTGRLPPPIVASEWQQECQPSSSASAIVFKRRGDSGCTSPERVPMAVGARPPVGLDNGYCGEEEDDDEGEDDDDNLQVCSSSESGRENTASHARRRPLPPPGEWQMLGRETSTAAARPPSTVSRILASALLPSTSYQQKQRQRRKRQSPQHHQLPQSDALQLMVFDGDAGGEVLPPAAGDSAATFPCTLCQSRFKYKRGLVSHVKRKHRDPVEDPDERQRAVEFLQLLKDQRHTSSRKRAGSFGACSTSGSLAGASHTGVAAEETAFAAVGDSVGSDDDDCDGRSASGVFCQQSSASGVLLTVVDSAGSAGASDFGDDVNGNDENDLFDGRGATTSAEAAPARIASSATAVAVAGSRDVRGRGNGGGRSSPTQPRWVAELRQNAPKFRPPAAATGRQPAAGSRDSRTEAGCPTSGDRHGSDAECKGAQGVAVSSSAGAAVSSSVGAVKNVNDGDPVPPPPGGKRRRQCEDLSTVRA